MARLRQSEIDEAIDSKLDGMSEIQIEKFKEITGTTSFRQYAKKSKGVMNKALSRIKRNLKKAYPPAGVDKQGFVLPKVKKTKTSKKKKPVATKKKPVSGKKKPVIKKSKRVERIEQRTKIERAPSGREYSKTEIREGKGSKRAIAYRKSKGIAIDDYEV